VHFDIESLAVLIGESRRVGESQMANEPVRPSKPESLDEIVSQSAVKLAEQIQTAAAWAKSEMDLQVEVTSALKEFARRAKVESLQAHHNVTIARGRPDSVYEGGVIVEYKAPGTLSPNKGAAPNQKLIEQLRQRFYDLKREENRDWKSIFGAGTDGKFFIFLRFRDEKWTDQEPLPVDRYSTERFLWALYNLGQKGKPYQPEYLHGDFGSESPVAQEGVRALYEEILTTTNPKAQVFFNQWKILFGEVCGYDVENLSDKLKKLAEFYVVKGKPQPAQLLFAVHTYYAILIKLLASEIVSFFNPWMTRQVEKLQSATTSAKLKRELEDLERGGVFHTLGITNFLESDLFAWYLAAWTEPVEKLVRKMITKLDEYNPGTFSEEPAQSRDLLKKLYQQLFPKSVRHDLGEYYTPDWLAEHVLNELGYEGDPDKRLLDPACGSGTFLVMAINRIRHWYDLNREKCAYDEGELLKKILANVIGFDLNPLAVMAARTNYLVAVKDLIRHVDKVEIPIYLCDSILTPSQAGSHEAQMSFLSESGVEYDPGNPPMAVKTAVGIFLVPAEIASNHEHISKYAELLQFCVTNKYGSGEFLLRCEGDGIPVSETHLHVEFYEKLVQLDSDKRNGLWARIIKNAFAPLFTDKVDFVAGNPPWVRWGYLPRDYREESVPLWQNYGLFSLKGFEARLGSGEKDLSQLFTYVSIDKYLRPGGKLGFLITKTVFKAKGQAEGFRRFRLGPSGEYFKICHVDDISLVQPFEGAANLTSSFVALKGERTAFPVEFTVWSPKPGFRALPDRTLQEVLGGVSRARFNARPVTGEDNSQWQTSRSGELSAFSKVMGTCSYHASVGARVEPYGVFLLRTVTQVSQGLVLVENLPGSGKRDIAAVQRELEPDLLYPIVRGKDIERWFSRPSSLVLMVQDPQLRRGFDESWLKKTYPYTYKYLREFRSILESRAAFKKYHAESGHPFYSMFNISADTFAPFKVAWRRMGNDFRATVLSKDEFPPLGEKLVVPSDTVTIVPFESAVEAHYLASLLNSVPARATIYSYSSSGRGLGTPAILRSLRVHQYDSRNHTHRSLAEIGEKLTRLHGRPGTPRKDILAAEERLTEVASDYWQLNPSESAALREAVEEQELGGVEARGGELDKDIHSRMFDIGTSTE
jgi:SAM-dependent methyltransferase